MCVSVCVCDLSTCIDCRTSRTQRKAERKKSAFRQRRSEVSAVTGTLFFRAITFQSPAAPCFDPRPREAEVTVPFEGGKMEDRDRTALV